MYNLAWQTLEARRQTHRHEMMIATNYTGGSSGDRSIRRCLFFPQVYNQLKVSHSKKEECVCVCESAYNCRYNQTRFRRAHHSPYITLSLCDFSALKK